MIVKLNALEVKNKVMRFSIFHMNVLDDVVMISTAIKNQGC